MKLTIEGFNQAYVITLKKTVKQKNKKDKEVRIDCTDLVILRWFVDFYPRMEKVFVDGNEYAWILHSKVIEDLPILDITNRALSERLQKMVSFGILTYELIHDKNGVKGNYTVYGFGVNYINLINSSETNVVQTTLPNAVERNRQCSLNGEAYYSQPTYKDKSISYSLLNDYSINNISINQSIYTLDYVKAQINYEMFSNEKDIDLIDEMVLIIHNIINSNLEYITIAGDKVPVNVVKSQFLKLTGDHIAYVLMCLNSNTTEIKNIKAYLITCLYNSIFTINNYYSAMVRHDLNS